MLPLSLLQSAALEEELTASTQEISRLRAQVSRLESDSSARESSSGRSSTAQTAELVALRGDVQRKEDEMNEMRLQLESALYTSTEVHPTKHIPLQFYHIFISGRFLFYLWFIYS